MEIHSDHDNIGVNIICPLDKIASYVIRREDVINVLCAMKCTKLQKHWIIYVGESSAVLIEAIFDRHLWNEIWTKLQETFDCENPVPNKGNEKRIISMIGKLCTNMYNIMRVTIKSW